LPGSVNFGQVVMWYGDGTGNTTENYNVYNQNALVAIRKGMWAVKLLLQNPPVLNWGRDTG